MYASSRRVTPTSLPVKQEEAKPAVKEKPSVEMRVKEESQPVENVVKVESTVKEFPLLPTVHFKRNSLKKLIKNWHSFKSSKFESELRS